jgi:hypothetical protein
MGTFCFYWSSNIGLHFSFRRILQAAQFCGIDFSLTSSLKSDVVPFHGMWPTGHTLNFSTQSQGEMCPGNPMLTQLNTIIIKCFLSHYIVLVGHISARTDLWVTAWILIQGLYLPRNVARQWWGWGTAGFCWFFFYMRSSLCLGPPLLCLLVKKEPRIPCSGPFLCFFAFHFVFWRQALPR